MEKGQRIYGWWDIRIIYVRRFVGKTKKEGGNYYRWYQYTFYGKSSVIPLVPITGQAVL